MRHLRLLVVYLVILLLYIMLPAQVVGKFGNTNGNLLNGGKMAEKDGFLYYINPDKGGLFKIKTDGTQNQALAVNNEYLECINIYDDHIYFLVTGPIYSEDEDGGEYWYKQDDSGTRRICRTDLDGKNRTEIIVDDVAWFMVANGYIYYTKVNSAVRGYYDVAKKNLFRTDINGKNAQKLAENVSNVNVTDENIYYVRLNDGGSSYDDDSYRYDRKSGVIHKIDLDGANNTVLKTEPTSLMVVDDGWIYYLVDSSQQYLYKIKADGTEKTLVLASNDSPFTEDGIMYYINVGKDTLYCHYNLDEKIFLSKDGKIKKSMFSTAREVYVLNDNMYYFDSDMRMTKPGGIYKINTNNNVITKISGVGTPDYESDITFIDGWIYFMRPDNNSPTNVTWYKAKTDGTEEVKLACAIGGKTDGEYAYYRNPDGIYRCALGSNTQELIFKHQTPYQYSISKLENGLLYCYDEYDAHIVMNLDGSNVKKLSYKSWATNSSADDFVYDISEGGAIVKMKPDGSQKSILYNTALLLKKDLTKDELRFLGQNAKGIYGACNSIYATSSYIYYNFVGMGAAAFCRVTHDDKTIERISNNICYDFKIVNGWIYYTNRSGEYGEGDDGAMYKISGNLKTKEKVNLLPEGATTNDLTLDKSGNIYYSVRNEGELGMYLYKTDTLGENKVVLLEDTLEKYWLFQ